MAVARSEQDRDVGRLRRARDAGDLVAHRRVLQEPRDLGGRPVGGFADGAAYDDAERTV